MDEVNFVTFNIILDDVVFPNGRTAMALTGGGGPQTAFGIRLWGETVGLVADVGRDLPESAWAWLEACGIDTRGVRVIESEPSRTPRAWQVTEEDGRRTQVWRSRPSYARTADSLPESYRRARGFHLGLHPDTPDLEFVNDLRRFGGLASIELFRPAVRRLEPAALAALLSSAGVFSANFPEAASLVGPGSPRSLARRLVEAAESRAQIIVLRLADQGSLIVEGQAGQAARVPAVPVQVLNTVGAGNAYCGGFLAGWSRSHDIARAGACAAVAASFAVEQVGLPVIADPLRDEAQRRFESLLPLVEYTSL